MLSDLRACISARTGTTAALLLLPLAASSAATLDFK